MFAIEYHGQQDLILSYVAEQQSKVVKFIHT